MTQKRLIFFLLVTFFVGLGGYTAIQLAKGYKFDFTRRSFRPTGLLVATSVPDGAQIYLNGKLTSATNNTISLSPSTYGVEIKKEGYAPWKKTLKVEQELVVKTDAWLFPMVPDFRALTFTGAANPLISPDGTKIVYQVANSKFPEKNGLWVLDISDGPLGLTKEPKQIARSAPQGRDFAETALRWSLDSRQILVTFLQENFLLDPGSFTPAIQLVDITDKLTTIKTQWEKENSLKKTDQLVKLPPELVQILGQKAQDVLFSPDETKILYTATASATIPEKLIPPLPGSSTQPQERILKPNQTYVYDIKEDRNFLITDRKVDIGSLLSVGEKTTKDLSPTLTWFPTSRHLLMVQKDKIQILEYDDTNWVTVYASSYQFPFAFPYPAGNKLLILTNLSTTPDSSANLYAINLR